MVWRLIRKTVPNAKIALWRLKNPRLSFKHFYADSAAKALSDCKPHASLGPNTANDGEGTFDSLVRLGIQPQDAVVDYGCGTLRVGRFLIEYLDADLYIGMDIDMRILGVGRAALPPALLETKRPTLELISRETLAEVAARRPKWVFSKGVLQHVPPRDLDEYFKNLSCLIHSGATGWIKSSIGRKATRLSPKTWVHSLDQINGIVARHGMRFEKIGKKLSIYRLVALDTAIGRDSTAVERM